MKYTKRLVYKVLYHNSVIIIIIIIINKRKVTVGCGIVKQIGNFTVKLVVKTR